MKNKKILVLIVALALAVIGGFMSLPSEGSVLKATSKTGQEMLESFELSHMSTKEMVATLEDRLNEPKTLINAGVQYDGIYLSNGKRQVILEEKGMFYLSIAPYMNKTHPCGSHNLVTCRGEMVNQAFDVLVMNDQGDVIINETISTLSNGFMGIWLPKDMKGTITIKQGNYLATGLIETTKGSPTCNTTLKLS